ncbi:MAG TPA: oligosaccharide flippase family protein [Parasegetibacter sp.]
MGNIRKQSLFSSGIIFIGFLVGALNTYLFTKGDGFTLEEYGLTRIFFDMGQTFFAIASLGVIPVIYKFFPYFKYNLPDHENDLLTWCLLAGLIGFVLLLGGGILMEPLIVRKFIGRSPLIVEYYYWIFPFTFFLLFYSILECYTWQLKKTIFPNFLRETGLRLLTTVIIALKISHIISYDTFVKLFSLLFGAILVALIVYMIRLKSFHFTFRISRVSRKFFKKMFTLVFLTYSGVIITVLAQTLDGIFIASFQGLADAGIFTLATYITSLIMIPQRGLQPISIPVLSKAWKDKNMGEIDRIYRRSSINLLAIGLFLFLNIWLNMADAIIFFGLKPEFLLGMTAVLVMGISKLIDLGTGVNNLIITTSIYWRFEFYSGVFLLGISIPANYFLIKHYGITGAAFSNLISLTLYNAVRIYFLWYKYRLQPFSPKTVYVVLLAVCCYALAYFPFRGISGFGIMILRSLIFTVPFIAGVFYFHITPDAWQFWNKVKENLGISK